MPDSHAALQATLQHQLAAIRTALFFSAMGRDRIAYRTLRSLGASPEEALNALVASGSDQESQVAFMSIYLPHGLGVGAICRILERHRIHPLSVAISFEDQRRALSFLRRLNLLDQYAAWISAGGRLRIWEDLTIRALPPGLVLYGPVVIAHCPALLDLGEGLVIQGGPLLIENCPQLQRLPRGFRVSDRGKVVVANCASFEGLGTGTSIEEAIEVRGCPMFTSQVHVN